MLLAWRSHFCRCKDQQSIKKLASFAPWHLCLPSDNFRPDGRMSQRIATRREESEGGTEGKGMWERGGKGGANCAASYLHYIAADRTEHSSSWLGPPDAPGVHRVPISRQPQAALFSSRISPSSLGPCVGQDELKRPENSLRTARDRSGTRDRGITCVHVCVCVYGLCRNYCWFLRSKINLDWFLGGRSPSPWRNYYRCAWRI